MDKKIRFWDPGRMYAQLKDEMQPEIDRVLSEGKLILQEDVEIFEQRLAEKLGKKYAVALNSGTDALFFAFHHLPYQAFRVTGRTFWATLEAAIHAGRVPVIQDIDENGLYNGGHVPVHIAGDVAESEVPIVEDACQAICAPGVGHGLIQCYSFYPAKILGSYGDAGAVTTDDKEIADHIRALRNHGGKPKPQHVGYNSRMDNLQAAVLNVKLNHLNDNIARRKEIAQMYDDGMEKLVELPREREVCQDYIIRTEDRDDLYNRLAEKGIETMKDIYPFPPEWEAKKGPNTVEWERTALRLPIDPVLTNEEIRTVIDEIIAFYEK